MQQAHAEAAKKIAEAEGDAQSILTRAKAQATSNQILSQSLTSELVEYNKWNRWDGVLPKVTGGNSLIDLKSN